jgi:hypothetical protein
MNLHGRTVSHIASLAAFLLLLNAGCHSRRTVSAVAELAALTNLATFCEPPAGASAMESTWDRRGGNVDWWEIPPPLPGSTNLYEALRVEGPGCIRRIWQTNTQALEWLFYLDGEAEPRLRLTQDELFGMDSEPDRHATRGSVSGGCYTYVPIPFARSIRVALRLPPVVGARPYFQINYERFPAGTPVVSWTPSAAAAVSDAVARVNAAWNPQRVADAAAETVRGLAWRRLAVPPGQQAVLLDEPHGGTLVSLGVRPDFSALGSGALRAAMLRCLVLECTWDGAAAPSVQVPLGDFFCNGLQPRRFASLPMANVNGAYLCRLPMPFRRGARIVIRNDGPVAVPLDVATTVAPGDPGNRLYLHAAFHAALGQTTPLEMLRTTGSGKYVGSYLVALGMDGSWNILEGDEIFRRDGQDAPVHHGTGLEDYFNGGWYYFGLCDMPLHGLLEKAAMRTAQYRFHLTDPVTFRRDLRLEWECGGQPGAPPAGYLSGVAYWYQDHPGPANSVLPPLNQRFPPLEQVGMMAAMSELFELERLGLIADAMERCAYDEVAWRQVPEHAFFTLRRLAYREMLLGHAAVRDELAALAAQTNLLPGVSAQARLLLWRGEKPGRAIFGAHGYCDYRLFVDGQPVGQGNDFATWQAFPVELSPGEHLLQAEITARPQYAFFSAGFSAFFTNVVTDTSWDFARTKPEGWPASSGDRKLWQPYEGTPGIVPTMMWWRFAPNAIPCVQSWHQVGGPCGDWQDLPGRTAYLRRRIVVPAVAGDRPPAPPRRYLDNTATPVRPRDDTSNEGMGHGK